MVTDRDVNWAAGVVIIYITAVTSMCIWFFGAKLEKQQTAIIEALGDKPEKIIVYHTVTPPTEDSLGTDEVELLELPASFLDISVAAVARLRVKPGPHPAR